MLRSLVLLLVLAGNLAADIRYQVDYLLPRGGARGATVTVEFHGVSLEDPKEILFYQPGIKASGFVPLAKPGDGFKVFFYVAPDCPLGEHVLRVRTATALSRRGDLLGEPVPDVLRIGDQNRRRRHHGKGAADSHECDFVEGQILPGPDMDKDFYRVQVQQGDRISVEVEAARLGTLHFQGENDLSVRILDSAGKELGHNDDSALYVQDPVLSVIAPRTGAYFYPDPSSLKIFYQPRQAWYRAHIGNFSRPTAIFPAGGQAGSTISARILGDPQGERTEQVDAAAGSRSIPIFFGWSAIAQRIARIPLSQRDGGRPGGVAARGL